MALRLGKASAMLGGAVRLSALAASVNSLADQTVGRIRAGVVVAAILLGLFGMHALGQHGWGHPADMSEMPPNPVEQSAALHGDGPTSAFGRGLSSASSALDASWRMAPLQPAAMSLASHVNSGISPPAGSLRDAVGVCVALLTAMLLARRHRGEASKPRWRRMGHCHANPLARTSRIVGAPNRIALAVHRC